MTAAELVGPSPHDGMRLDLPPGVDAVVVITQHDGNVHATLNRRRGSDISNDDLAVALLECAMNVPDGANG